MTEKVKNRYEWIYKTVVIAGLTVCTGSIMSFAPKLIYAVNHLTFMDAAQRERAFQKIDEIQIISESDKQTIFNHMKDENLHMSKEEKEQLIIIRENQKSIGEDLQEIKNLLKRDR